jgi:hypothetical protein
VRTISIVMLAPPHVSIPVHLNARLTQSITVSTFLEMVMRLTHVQNRKTFSLHREESELLLRALNDEMGPAVKGNTDVVEPGALAWLVTHLQDLDYAASRQKRKKGDSLRNAAERQRVTGRNFLEINHFLERYVAVPQVVRRSMDDPQAQGWTFEWARQGYEPYVELKLIQRIINIAQGERISLLKQCKQCQRWIFTRLANQTFCPGGKCREEFHKTSPEDKERRRTWARKNYQAHRAMNS